MSHQSKYFKYKNKYLKLKNQVGSAKNTIPIIREQRVLVESGEYDNIILDAESNITMIRKSDGANIMINFPDSFPVRNIITIDINDIKTDIKWNKPGYVHTILKSLKESDEQFDKKVLILCHSQKVTGSFTPMVLNNHWLGSEYNNIFAEYKLTGNPKFETIDIIPGGTYQDDAFSDTFIENHINDYDMILVPDCGGIWYELQKTSIDEKFRKIRDLTEDEQNQNKTLLIEKSLNLTRMLKPNGIIYFGKFLSETPCIIRGKKFATFSDALNYSMNNHGLISQIKIINSMVMIISQKS